MCEDASAGCAIPKEGLCRGRFTTPADGEVEFTFYTLPVASVFDLGPRNSARTSHVDSVWMQWKRDGRHASPILLTRSAAGFEEWPRYEGATPAETRISLRKHKDFFHPSAITYELLVDDAPPMPLACEESEKIYVRGCGAEWASLERLTDNWNVKLDSVRMDTRTDPARFVVLRRYPRLTDTEPMPLDSYAFLRGFGGGAEPEGDPVSTLWPVTDHHLSWIPGFLSPVAFPEAEADFSPHCKVGTVALHDSERDAYAYLTKFVSGPEGVRLGTAVASIPFPKKDKPAPLPDEPTPATPSGVVATHEMCGSFVTVRDESLATLDTSLPWEKVALTGRALPGAGELEGKEFVEVQFVGTARLNGFVNKDFVCVIDSGTRTPKATNTICEAPSGVNVRDEALGTVVAAVDSGATFVLSGETLKGTVAGAEYTFVEVVFVDPARVRGYIASDFVCPL